MTSWNSTNQSSRQTSATYFPRLIFHGSTLVAMGMPVTCTCCKPLKSNTELSAVAAFRCSTSKLSIRSKCSSRSNQLRRDDKSFDLKSIESRGGNFASGPVSTGNRNCKVSMNIARSAGRNVHAIQVRACNAMSSGLAECTTLHHCLCCRFRDYNAIASSRNCRIGNAAQLIFAFRSERRYALRIDLARTTKKDSDQEDHHGDRTATHLPPAGTPAVGNRQQIR